MTVAVGLTAYWLWQALDFTVNNKTVANIDTMQFPIGHVHFPAVTACSFNLVSRRAALRLLDNWTFPRNISKDQVFEEMRLLPIAMFRGRSAFLAPNALKTTLFLNKVSIETLMRELAVPCEELVVRCAWQDKIQDCRKIFRMVKTFEGYCCAFNYIGDHNSSFEETENEPHPLEKSVATTGSDDGLVILVRTDKQDYHATMFSSYGTKLLISRPRSYISETARLVVVAPSTLIMVSYTPALTTTSPEVKALDKGVRDCVIDNEVSLAYFKLYTYHNCLEECKINITERYCGCVLTTYYTTNMDRVCDLNDLPCLASHQALINSYMLSDEFTHVDVQQLRTAWPTPCGCKPRCYYTQYSADTSRSGLDFTHYDTSESFYRGLNLSNGEYSLMYVFPRNLIATRLRRDVYTSFTSLLGSFGSLLSFFLGFSVVSLLELIYFLVIKPCLHIYHDRYIIYQYLFK